MTCLFRFIFHFPCPTCGVTRAMLSLLRGDVQGYFFYNAMALPLCCATVLFFCAEKWRIKWLKCTSLLVFLCNIPYYVYRLAIDGIP